MRSGLFSLIALYFLAACSINTQLNHDNVDKKNLYGEDKVKSVYVVNYSWHSGVILKKSEIIDEMIPEKEDFPDANFLEIGWGNKAFYLEPEFKISVAAKALFFSDPSTMYVRGFQNDPTIAYARSKLVKLALLPKEYAEMLAEIDSTFDRKGKKRLEATQMGFYDGASDAYYDAVGSYGMFNTCNMWTARVLKRGGIPISTSVYSATAGHVISQVSPYGEIYFPEMK